MLGKKEVVKIGRFGNGAHSSACSTQGRYCGWLSTATDPLASTGSLRLHFQSSTQLEGQLPSGISRLSVAKGSAETLTDAAKAGTPAQCYWFSACWAPSVVAERELHWHWHLRGEVRMSARTFEDGGVKADKAVHNGKAPKYNVMEGCQR